jgi:hypothetical protein
VATSFTFTVFAPDTEPPAFAAIDELLDDDDVDDDDKLLDVGKYKNVECFAISHKHFNEAHRTAKMRS